MKRPSLSLVRRRGHPKADNPADPSVPAVLGRFQTDDDVRILRRTRLRLMAVSGGVTFVILLALGGVTYFTAARLLDNNGQDAVRQSADQATQLVARDPRPVRRPIAFGEDSSILTLVLPKTGPALVVTGPDATQPLDLPYQPSLDIARNGGTDLRNVTLASSNLSVRIYSCPAGSDGTVVQVVQDRTPEVQFLSALLVTLAVGGLLAMLLALLAGYLYAGRALVPIRQSIDRRQAALQRQREFAANASHELRTPLTVITASVEDLRRNQNSKVRDVGEALGDIEAEARHLTALVEDMLLLARTDSGVVQVERMPMDLADVAAEVAGSLTTLGQERGVSVLLDPLPAPVTGDPLRLRQLVTILADNAIRHSPKGSTVVVQVRPDTGSAVVQVDDQGSGIKPDDLPRLFERFWRADDAPAGGTGLGLAIARWIVDQHGGTIAAENRPEGGAKFTVRLPSGSPVVQPAVQPAAQPAVGGDGQAVEGDDLAE